MGENGAVVKDVRLTRKSRVGVMVAGRVCQHVTSVVPRQHQCVVPRQCLRSAS